MPSDNNMSSTSEDTVTELLPCPFCGAKPDFGDAYLAQMMGHEPRPYCPNGHTVQMPADAWNTRVSIPVRSLEGGEIDRIVHAAVLRSLTVLARADDWSAGYLADTIDRHLAALQHSSTQDKSDG